MTLNISLVGLNLKNSLHASPFISERANTQFSLSSIFSTRSFSQFLRLTSFNSLSKFSFSHYIDTAIVIQGDMVNQQRLSIKNKITNIRDGRFTNCKSTEHGGAIFAEQSNISIEFCEFISNSARYSGAVELRACKNCNVSYTLFQSNSAERFGAMLFDGKEPLSIGNILHTNFSNNVASKWIGGLRIQWNQGQIFDTVFSQNKAQNYAATFDFTSAPSIRNISYAQYINNTADERAAAYTSFLCKFMGSLRNSIFHNNQNSEPFGRSIFVWADSAQLIYSGCTFDGPKNQEVIAYFDTSELIDEGNNTFNSQSFR